VGAWRRTLPATELEDEVELEVAIDEDETWAPTFRIIRDALLGVLTVLAS